MPEGLAGQCGTGYHRKKGWVITCLCVAMKTCYASYSWSIIKGEIHKRIDSGDPEWTWGLLYLNVPYSVGFFVSFLGALPSGFCYDKYGPRIVITVGAFLIMFGMLICSWTSDLYAWIFGFGVCTNLGYSAMDTSLNPTALRWHPASKAGLVTGIVQGGKSLSPFLISPLAEWLTGEFGILMTMRCLSVISFVVIAGLGQFLHFPPATSHDPGLGVAISTVSTGSGASFARIPHTQVDFSFSEAVRTQVLWLGVFGYTLASGVGVMMISKGTYLAKEALGDQAGICLYLMSFATLCGKLQAGVLNDRLGLRKAMLIYYSSQAVAMLGLVWIPKSSAIAVLAIASWIGANFGALMCLWMVFPKVFFGLKAYAKINGIILMGWGVGGFVLPNIGQVLDITTGSGDATAYLALVLMLIGLTIIPFLNPPVKKELAEESTSQSAIDLSQIRGA